MGKKKFSMSEWVEHDWKNGEHVWGILYDGKSIGWAPEGVVEAVITSVKHQNVGSEYEYIEIEAKQVDITVKGEIYRTSGYLKDAEPYYNNDHPWSVYVFLTKEDALWKAEISRKRGIEEYRFDKKDAENRKKKYEKAITKVEKEVADIEQKIEYYTNLKYE